MPTGPLGSVNPRLLEQCPEHPVPANALDLPINVTRWRDRGERVLLIHGGVQGGIGGGPANYAGQKPLAARGWRLELMDRPGFGESPSRGPDDMEADSILIAGLLGDGAHLIGHSFGGAEALLATARRPEAVRSLILIEPALQPMLAARPGAAEDPAAKAAGGVVMRYLLSAETPAAFARSFVGNLGRSENGERNSAVARLDDDTKAAALGCSLLQSRMAPPPAMLAAAHAVRAAGIRTLVVTGGYSEGQEVTGKAVAEETGGRHLVVACSSHFIQQAVPDKFNEVADAFMRQAT